MILVLGGSGCGKSAYAEKRIQEAAVKNHATIYYLATMQVYGEEGRKKVERHIELRRGKGMLTIEQTREIADSIRQMQEGPRVVLLEDLGNLVANEMFQSDGTVNSPKMVAEKIVTQLKMISAKVSGLIIVSNNVFEDGIEYEEGTMNYIRALGEIHQKLTGEAEEVVEVVAGIPVILKV